MKRFHKLIVVVLSLTMITLISGCSGGGSDTATSANTTNTPTAVNTAETPTDTNSGYTPTDTSADVQIDDEDIGDSSDIIADTNVGTVALSLTDAPTDDENIKGVYVTFTALRYQYKNVDESDNGWQDVNLSEPRTVDLLALQDGNTTLLNQTDLPAGEIDHVRFVLDVDNCYVLLEGNITEMLTVPSGDQTGYKAIGGFTIPAGGTISVTADFDLRKSLVINKNKYLLNPTIKIIDDIEVGGISGAMSLDANGSKVIVYAYEDGSWDDNESNASNNFGNAVLSTDATDGSYTLPWLTVGDYDLVVVATDVTGVFENILGYLNDVPVAAGETTAQDINDTTLLSALP